MSMKRTDLSPPITGYTYWVIRYPQDLDPEYPVEPEDFCTAHYMGDNKWQNNYVVFKSHLYMEVPTL